MSFYKWTLDGAESNSFTPMSGSLQNLSLPVTMDQNHTAVAHYGISLCNAVDKCDLVWETNSAPGNWEGQQNVCFFDNDAAQSPDLSSDQSSSIWTTVYGPSSLSFYWKVSSEPGFDTLSFYIDNVLQESISGEVDWEQQTFPISEGTHTLKWTYSKDQFISLGSDAGWLDKVEYTIPDVTLNVQKESGGGSTDPPEGSYTYKAGTEITIKANPQRGYRFDHWDGDIPQGSENTNPLVITLDSNKTIKCHFIRQYTLDISSNEGGTTSPPPGNHLYDTGTEITITALPSTHYVFTHWSGDIKEENNQVTLIMDTDKSLRAHFLRKIYPPVNFFGRKIFNRSLFTSEYINVLTWTAHPANRDISKYRIYLIEGGQPLLLLEMDADIKFFNHRGIDKDKNYSYALSAINSQGREGQLANITII